MSGKPWFRADPDLRCAVQHAARELQPELYWVVEGQTAFLRGTFHVVDDGDLIDRYQVEIEFPHNYPDERPVVHETAGRIPLDPDRHINRDGTACLFLDDEYQWRHPDGISFPDFLDEVMMGYFTCQAYYEQEGEWLLDERPHSASGVFDFYSDVVGTEDVRVIIRYLDYIERDASGHWDCPCGSGENLRDCHRDLMWKLQDRISGEAARRSKETLESALRKLAQRAEKKRQRARNVIREHVG